MMRRRIDGEGAGRGVVRLFQGVGAIAGWYVSFMFSVMGFVAWRQSDDMTRLAYCIVVFFTALQLWVNHQNRDDPNYGLALSGIVSYGYGIITNIMGILTLGGTTLGIAWDTHAYWQIALALCLGVPLELGPESLFMKALFPNSRNMVSDAAVGIGKLFKDIFSGDGGSSYEPYDRPSVDDLMTSSTRSATRSRSPLNPRNQPATPSVRPAPMTSLSGDDEQSSNDPWHYLH